MRKRRGRALLEPRLLRLSAPRLTAEDYATLDGINAEYRAQFRAMQPDRWGELSGQTQGWSLFAPIVGHQASLPEVSYNRREYLDSEFKPVDPNVYFRLPSPRCRLFNYEYRLALLTWTWTPESQRENPETWRKATLRRVWRQNRSMLAYMRWRSDRFLREVRLTAGSRGRQVGCNRHTAERPSPHRTPVMRCAGKWRIIWMERAPGVPPGR